jgi:trans-aconitate methyltransferase
VHTYAFCEKELCGDKHAFENTGPFFNLFHNILIVATPTQGMDWTGEVSALYNQYVHEQSSFFSFCSKNMVDALSLKPGAEVLDLAGGAGTTSRMILSQWPGCNITILDASAEQLEHARHIFMDKVSYSHSKAELFTPQKKFDAIVCANAFWYLQPSIIPRIATWLAPGGVLVFNLHEQNTELAERNFFRHVYAQIDALSRERLRTGCMIYQRTTAVDELKGLLHANGFTLELHSISYEEPRENWKMLAELEARRIAPYMALSIPAEQKVSLFLEAFKSVAKQAGKVERHSLVFLCRR